MTAHTSIDAAAKVEDDAPETEFAARPSANSTYLLVPIVLLFALLLIAVIRSPSLMTQSGIGSAIIVASPLILATYALMATVIAGRVTVDLSIGPLIGFINVTLIQIYGAGGLQSPVSFFLYALAVGVAYQVLVGLIVIFVRVQPIIVALSGYLALSGLNLVILSRPGGVAPDWMFSWGAGETIWSPPLIIVVLATIAWLLFTRTAFYGHLRLMGSDERAAYTSGVPITAVRLGAHVIGGLFAGLSALVFTSLISSGDPNQGTTYTLISVTALVLGGASLAGGRASIFGALLGAVNLYLITYVLATFNFGAVQSFVTDLAYGSILVVSLLITIALPYFHKRLRYVSPLLFFVVLSILTLGVVVHKAFDYEALQPTPVEQSVDEDAVGEPAAVEAVPSPEPSDSAVFVFESAPLETASAEMPEHLRLLVFAAVLLIAIPVLLRIVVSRSGKSSLTPAVAIVVAALILLGLYVARDPDRFRGVLTPIGTMGGPSADEPGRAQ
jgi:ribose transport system permease protein